MIFTGWPIPLQKNSRGKIHVTKCLKSKSEIQEIQSGFDQKKCTEITHEISATLRFIQLPASFPLRLGKWSKILSFFLPCFFCSVYPPGKITCYPPNGKRKIMLNRYLGWGYVSFREGSHMFIWGSVTQGWHCAVHTLPDHMPFPFSDHFIWKYMCHFCFVKDNG